MIDKKTAIRLACRDYNYKWPKHLFTGVMMYEGFRITIEEFNKEARLFN